ncbi:SNF1- protein kinase regulatory subunit gamma-1-like [Lathyrus oleraceus]|uniref:SNF1- protein kinase regulatory subunit gamma-1-like n=1 Tax=Pisum sativum TaxID=3888 RepID=A0A9D5B297_PEA|nr:SNF1- protein kinase regulatory subunit gamma-1-like [Pisum sativum]
MQLVVLQSRVDLDVLDEMQVAGNCKMPRSLSMNELCWFFFSARLGKMMEDVGKQNARLGSFLFWAEGFKMQNGRVAVDWQSKVVPCPLLLVADKTMAKDAPQAANNLGEDFYKVILQEEPFKSTTVGSILKSYRWAPFVPVAKNSAMLTVLLLLSKYRLRNVPVIEPSRPLSDLGLPFMSADKVISVQSNELILEAFKIMRDHQIGGLPVVEGPTTIIVGNLSIRDIRYLLLKPEIFSNFRYTHNSCSGFCRVHTWLENGEPKFSFADCVMYGLMNTYARAVSGNEHDMDNATCK